VGVEVDIIVKVGEFAGFMNVEFDAARGVVIVGVLQVLGDL